MRCNVRDILMKPQHALIKIDSQSNGLSAHTHAMVCMRLHMKMVFFFYNFLLYLYWKHRTIVSCYGMYSCMDAQWRRRR